MLSATWLKMFKGGLLVPFNPFVIPASPGSGVCTLPAFVVALFWTPGLWTQEDSPPTNLVEARCNRCPTSGSEGVQIVRHDLSLVGLFRGSYFLQGCPWAVGVPSLRGHCLGLSFSLLLHYKLWLFLFTLLVKSV